jgi:hypothetical protein
MVIFQLPSTAIANLLCFPLQNRNGSGQGFRRAV